MNKFFRIMRLTVFFTIASIYCALAVNSYSQEIKISLKSNVYTVEELFEAIKQQSDISFWYRSGEIDLKKEISIQTSNHDLQDLLEKSLSDQGLSYVIENKHVIIFKKSEGLKDSPTGQSQVGNKVRIKGQVYDNAEPPNTLPGVTISIKGTSIGVVSDDDGFFNIDAGIDEILVFSSIGFTSLEYTVRRAQSNLVISLQATVSQLNEVVVTGYSEERKLNTISAISQVKIDATMRNKPITSLSQALQGGVTGLAVTQSSGLPGGDAATIKIRGISTLGHSDPLVLVDGIPMDMNHLDPNTIESVTVLKDAAAAAIYGARAANGVIVVKTKRGSVGKVTVSYNGYAGIQEATYMPNFVDAPTYMRMVNEAFANIGGDPVYSAGAISSTASGTDPINYPNTNWKDELWKNQFLQNHSLSVIGGNSVARFAITGNYLQQNGFVKNFNYERLNLRANSTVNLRENISVGVDINMIRTAQNQPSVNETGGDNPLNLMFWTPPTIAGKYPNKPDDKNTYYGNYGSFLRNPLAQIEHGGKQNNLADNISINIQPHWIIIPNLNVRGQFSYRVTSGVYKQDRRSINFFDYFNGQLIATWNNYSSASTSRSSYYYVGGTVDYTLNLDDHRLFFIAGSNAELTNSNAWDEYSMHSVFGKINYSYLDKYLLEFTLRTDGSSRFGKGNKYGTFPSFGLGWNIHKESFMSSVTWLSNFKARGSYGQLGNENIGLYRYQNLIDYYSGKETIFGNPDITWETVNMLDIGADISLFNGVLDITFDYYDKLTKDIILNPPLSMVAGIGTAPINAGEVRNKGWEVSANFMQQIGKWEFSLFGGISKNKNKIESLLGGPYDSGSSIHKEGYGLSSHYVYKSSGLLQESDFTTDASGKLIPVPGVVILSEQKPGDVRYIDVDGDGSITLNDREIRGTSEPDFNYFINPSIKWNNFDFEVMFQGVQGVEAYYSGPYSMPMNLDGVYSTTPQKMHQDYWTPANTDARFPRLTPSPMENNRTSTFWEFDASYCRVKYIQIGYRLKPSITNKINISNVRFFINLQNIFTFAKEDVIDPESRGSSTSSYPLVKTYSAGLNITF